MAPHQQPDDALCIVGIVATVVAILTEGPDLLLKAFAVVLIQGSGVLSMCPVGEVEADSMEQA
jgi:hypothetical protein